MADEKTSQENKVDNLEVEPLSDEDLESVPGGAAVNEFEDCSCGSTGGNCTA